MKYNSIKREITKDHIGQYALFPRNRRDFDQFEKIRKNEVTLTETKHYRTKAAVQLFDKYHAICTLIAENCEGFYDHDDADEYLRWKAGMVDHSESKKINGQLVTILKLKSISWARMGPDTFEKFFNKCMPHICEMLGCTEEDVINNTIFQA